MAINRAPAFPKEANTGVNNSTTMGPTLTAAAADFTGVSANNVLSFTAGADNSILYGLDFSAIGTNVATVVRIYLNNGGVNTTATNNELIGQVSLPATTTSAVAALPVVPWYYGFKVKTGFRIYVGLGTAVAAGWVASQKSDNY